MAESKLKKLKAILRMYPGAIVAFSGGVDSSLLLAVAQEVLAENVIAVTAVSPIHPAAELRAAKEFTRDLGCAHRIIRSRELNNECFVQNTNVRCYHCKHHLFTKIKEIAAVTGFPVIEGTNTTDLHDYRPGIKALRELGIQSPFIAAGMSKKDIRRLARQYRIRHWDRPAAACLASRIPFGTRITAKNLIRVERAEQYLSKMGFSTVRVRDHHPLARIEVGENDLKRAVYHRTKIIAFMKKLGYRYICVDIEGYRTGSLNPAP